MRVLPQLYSGPMVRSILDGRKTKTRRLLKHAPNYDEPEWRAVLTERGWRFIADSPNLQGQMNCAEYCDPCDLFYVRESVTRFDKGTCDQHIWYRAGRNDGVFTRTACDYAGKADGDWPHGDGPAGGAPYNVPSIHMPRWASRLTLDVTDVKIERLQDITEEDATAEGVYTGKDGDLGPLDISARALFSDLWDSIYGKGAGAANPWVVAISFNVIKQNVDEVLTERGLAA